MGAGAEKSDDNLLIQFWLERLMTNSLKNYQSVA